MPDEKTVYASEADHYEALISHEDYQHNLMPALEAIASPDGRDVIDLGAGTGRLAGLLAPRAARLFAFDASPHMLALTRRKLGRLASGRALTAVADHRRLPLPPASADLAVSGWSVSYLAVWNPNDWRAPLDAWLAEMHRIVRPGGAVILFESLGTGNESPIRLPHLDKFYPWLEQAGFRSTWIRTDYRFDSVAQAAHLAGFFFGDEIAARIRREDMLILPECTGVWWHTFKD